MSTMTLPRNEMSVPMALPETDESRLMFYAELLMANVPSLIADLNSAKYAFLSFSEKTRNEVKQKSTLIQSIGRTLTSLQNARKCLKAARQSLQELETKLVRAMPPMFVTSAEARHLSRANTNGDTSTSAEETGNASETPPKATAGESRHRTTAYPDNVVILSEEDILPVREAEEVYAKETTRYTEISKACNTMEDALGHAHDQCRTMTENVQGLKWKFDEVYNGWKRAELDRRMVRLMRDELEERRVITREGLHGLNELEDECRTHEMRIIEDFIARAQADADAIQEELRAKRNRYELELTTYQIAYKEQQAEAELLREECKLLRSQQQNLEVLAKQQQLEEMDRNSLRKLMMETLTLTPSKYGRAEDRLLTSEQLIEVKNDHLLVSVLAARISILEEQRKAVGGLLARARGMGKNYDISGTVERIRTLLEPKIQLDDDALMSE
ncbi:hypothetical protein, conserved [Leishmania tarentolae]|uniref:DUF4201 domain-containing protein n=1 Tax=Leishmania tarentolae TaxID=5689 RepID=A0A640KTD0_LEITA|nr:hypothetical protein, conserved [Leishmania tarentolae]